VIKLIIFDLDGVLVNARELHYEALNEALATIENQKNLKYNIKKVLHTKGPVIYEYSYSDGRERLSIFRSRI